LTSTQLLAMAERTYHVFHIVVEEGSYARSNLASVRRAWQRMLGERVLMLSDHTELAEVIVSASQVTEGASLADTAHTWSGDTALVVVNALGTLAAANSKPVAGGLVTF
jgi:hypothetical protein